MIYDLIASIYHNENRDLDYEQWANFFEKMFAEHMSSRPELVLDLGCGTGKMTLTLARRGYDMTGVDYSPEMLDIARSEAAREELPHEILWLCQDMRELDLYGTVDGAICCLDSLNHITDYEKFKAAIARVSLFLEPGRLFIFDMNTAYKHECVLGNRTIVKETDEVFCVWQNEYKREERVTEISLDFFQEEDGAYYRSSEQFCERAYTDDEIATAISEAGLDLVAVFEEMTDTAPTDTTERAVYITRKR